MHVPLAVTVISAGQVNEQAVESTGIVPALAVLLVGCVSVVALVTVALFVMEIDPSPTTLLTLTTNLKAAVAGSFCAELPAPTGSVASVHVTVPVPPTAGVMQEKTGPEFC